MIELKDVSKIYKNKQIKGFKSKLTQVNAVNSINIKIPKGKITGLLGINGAGKTTTVKMISTLIEPTEGEIMYDGLDYRKNQKYIKQRINMIAGGERMIYWRLSARENLNYFARLYGLKGKKLNLKVNELIDMVGLSDKADIPVEKYSKGMKQRLQIARGLINNPEYIFLDEPTLGLDVQIAQEVRAIFRSISKENKGVLLTSHYMNEVEELCDYIYVMNDGKIIVEGKPKDLIKTIDPNAKNLEDMMLYLSNNAVASIS